MIGKSGKAYMNPQVGRAMEPDGDEMPEKVEGEMPPSIFHHSHSAGVTTHIFHHDGRHEMHEHQHGDAEGMAQHVHDHHGEGKQGTGDEVVENMG